MRLGSRMFTSVNTKSIIFGSVIVFACAAFIFTGFGSLHLGHLTSMSPTTAAQVGSLDVSMNEFVNAMNQSGYGNLNGIQKKYIASQIIKQLVNQKIFTNEAMKIGWTVSDQEIAAAIRTIPVFQDPTTHEFSLTLFKNYVASQQSSQVDFYNYLRNQMNLQNMNNLVFMPPVYPQNVVNNQYQINQTQFNLQYAVITVPENTMKQKVDEAAKTYVAAKDNLKNLQDLYNSQKDQYDQKQKTRVFSILVSYKGANRAQGQALNRTKEDAFKLIQAQLAQIQKGKSFAQLATETNDDEQAKSKKGDLGFVDDSSIDPVSLQAIAKLSKKNALSDVIDTPFGYRIFQFQESKPAVHKTFEDVKLDLAKQIVGNEVRLQTESGFQNQLSLALNSKDITKVNNLLAQNSIAWQFLGKQFKVTDKEIPQLGDATNLAEQVFSLKKSGDMIPTIIDFAGKKVIFKLESLTPPAAPSVDQLQSLQVEMSAMQGQLFAQSLIQELDQSYEKSGHIKINPIVTE